MPNHSNPPLAKSANISTVTRATSTGDIMALPYRARRWIPKTVITPDFTNQLDLFSEAPLDTPAPVASGPMTG